MFFSKKEEKIGWEIEDERLINYKPDGLTDEYKLSELYACFNKSEGRVCFWYEGDYLVNCKCSEVVFKKMVNDYHVFECNDYIPNILVAEYIDTSGQTWILKNGKLVGKENTFNLPSITIIEHQRGHISVNIDGDIEIFRLETKYFSDFKCAVDTALQQLMGSLSGAALERELDRKAQKTLAEELKRIAERNENIRANGYRHIILTTEAISPFPVEERLGIITAECAYGMNIFKDVFAAFSDFFGGRSDVTQNLLKDARENVLFELRKEAFERGADAVVAVDLDYSEFSGGGKSMLFMVASGTAIKIKNNA